MLARISLDQWRAFVATVEQGGFQQAADRLSKTQSAISHAVRKMEFLLGKALFRIDGRRAVLTPLGQSLLPHARQLLGEAQKLERLAFHHREGVQAELALAVDSLFPSELLDFALEQFSQTFPGCRVRLYETTLSGARELLEDGLVELAIAGSLPAGHVHEPLLNVALACVAAPGHELAELPGPELDDLAAHRQIVIRDSGMRSTQNSGWLGTAERWTVSSVHTALRMVQGGHGFAWLPEDLVQPLLASGALQRLPLRQQARREVALQLGYAQPRTGDPVVQGMARILRGLCGEPAGA